MSFGELKKSELTTLMIRDAKTILSDTASISLFKDGEPGKRDATLYSALDFLGKRDATLYSALDFLGLSCGRYFYCSTWILNPPVSRIFKGSAGFYSPFARSSLMSKFYGGIIHFCFCPA
jgi:hypothetical protein